MSVFGNLTTDGVEEAQDRLGGFRVLDTDAYEMTIKALYVGKSANSNARSVTLIAEDQHKSEYRETFWVTNKNDENFYVDKDKKKQFLPGYSIVDAICLMTTNKGLTAQAAEEKVINVYDPDQKKEMPKSVPMLVETLGGKVILGVVKELRNKQAKDSNNVYQDTADTREVNSVEVVFHVPSKMTAFEAKKGQTASFYGAWVERNRGKDKDRRTIKDGAQNGRSGRPGSNTPPKAGDSGQKTTSLFG